MAGKFELKKGKGGFRFNLKAPNGKAILTSETYQTKSGAENGIASVKANARDKSNFEERKAKNGQTYFVLKAGNGEIIGRSETYESSSGRENGIDSVKRNAGKARVEDKTTGK
jgi:uncharacterized protein YegP (UPF0339 family)